VDLIQAAVLGIAQGLTEFLPVSSTAHLRLIPALAGWPDPGAPFTAAVQLGTTAAVLGYFRHDLGRIVAGWARGIRSRDARTRPEWGQGWAVVAGTVPIVVVGLLAKGWIERDLRSLTVVGSTLVVLGLVMLVAERVAAKTRPIGSATVRDGLWIGLWQALAVVPGASRSGSTISGALLAGFDRAAAARLSFLLSVPAIVAAAAYSLADHAGELVGGPLAVPLLVANLCALASGWWAIAVLMRVMQTKGLWPFVAYRVVLGLAILWLVASGRMDAFVGMEGR
jgi:undecaprenyl-diphosphatase